MQEPITPVNRTASSTLGPHEFYLVHEKKVGLAVCTQVNADVHIATVRCCGLLFAIRLPASLCSLLICAKAKREEKSKTDDQAHTYGKHT